MVQKAAACGYATLAAVSAATARAARLAQRLDMSLVGFLRHEGCVVYTRNSSLAECGA